MEREFVIVIDSCGDLTKEQRSQLGIEYVKMGLVKKLKEGDVEVPADLNWDLYSNKELNDWMRDGMLIKTTQVSNQEYTEVFSRILESGKDILYIACSSALSGSYNFSLVVKEELLEKYPDAKIICVDSLCSSMGQGKMALDAATLKVQGKTIEEVASYVEESKLCYNQFATVETLDYLKKAGRIKASKAFFGNLFGVKPIIISDVKGNNYAFKKIKGRKNSLVELVNLLKESIVEKDNQTVYVCHADCIEDANFVKDLIEKEISPREVVVTYLGPIISVSTGPGTIGVYAKCTAVTIEGN